MDTHKHIDGTPKTLMPKKFDLGQHAQTTMLHPIHRKKTYDKNPLELNPNGLRVVMGFLVPKWQRPIVWTTKQRIRFIESAWRGLNLGTFTYNQSIDMQIYDGLLLDGQQRLNAVQRYLENEFDVFGYLWSEITDVDRRRFEMTTHFGCYVTMSNDENYLRKYYDIMNFSGTPHTEDQRALT